METQPLRHTLHPRRGEARWAVMPPVGDAARRAARGVLSDVRSLMATTRTSIACIQIDVSTRRQGRITLWRRSGGDSYEAIDASTAGGLALIADIRSGLSPAAREMAARWPETARPATIGFATDGHAIVFNPGHPGCDGMQWLDDHLAVRSPAAIVVDDGSEGHIAMLTGNRGMQ